MAKTRVAGRAGAAEASGAREESATQATAAREAGATKAPLAALVGVTILCVLLVAWRLRYGVDWTDEGLYVALPWRFVLGDRPFIEELDLHQTAALITYPFVWAWMRVVGSNTGIVLFLRVLWLAFVSGVAVVGYSLMKRLVAKPLAVACAAIYVVTIPFIVPSPSYNTIGSGLLTVGLALLAIDALAAEGGWARPALAGFAHALAIVAYPTLAVGAAVAIGSLAAIGSLTAVATRARRWRALAAYVSALGAALLATVVLLVSLVGVEQLRVSYDYTNRAGTYEGGLAKMQSIWESFVQYGAWRLGLPLALVVAVLLLWDRWPRARLALLALPLISLALTGQTHTRAPLLWVFSFGVLSLLLLLKRKREDPLMLAAVIVVPASLAGGLATAYTSNNGLLNAGLGMAPVLLIALPLLLESALDDARTPLRPAHVWLAVAALSALLLCMVAVDSSASYRDGPPLTLRTLVRSGPWAGIYTRPETALLLQSLRDDVAAAGSKRDRVLIYPGEPGAYLVANRRVAPPALWLAVGSRDVLDRFYASGRLPDLIVRIDLGRENQREYSKSPLRQLQKRARYERVTDRAAYDIYRLAE